MSKAIGQITDRRGILKGALGGAVAAAIAPKPAAAAETNETDDAELHRLYRQLTGLRQQSKTISALYRDAESRMPEWAQPGQRTS